jgi:hypothetical protein
MRGAWWCIVLVGCTLDSSDKHHCVLAADCDPGRVCNEVGSCEPDERLVLQPLHSRADLHLETPRILPAVVRVRDYLYVLGGLTHEGITNTVERSAIHADDTLEGFHRYQQSMTTARARGKALVIGHHLCVVSGQDDGPAAECAPIRGDGELDEFEVSPAVTLESTNSYFTTLVVGSNLYVIGGYTADDDSQHYISSVEVSRLSKEKLDSAFRLSSTLSAGWTYATAARIGNQVYLVGGRVDGDGAPKVHRASILGDGTLDTFQEVEPTPPPQMTVRNSGLRVGHTVYLFGGRNKNYSDKIWSVILGDEPPIFRPLEERLPKPLNDVVPVRVGRFVYLIGGQFPIADAGQGVLTNSNFDWPLDLVQWAEIR